MKLNRNELTALRELHDAAYRHLNPRDHGVDGMHVDVLGRVVAGLTAGYPIEVEKPVGALIIVDVQNDFLPGGALAVPDGDEVIEWCVSEAEQAEVVVASRDWHPADHQSFASQRPTKLGGWPATNAPAWKYRWPDHCVAGTPGAELHPEIAEVATVIANKGTERDREALSAFDGQVEAAGWGGSGLAGSPPLTKWLRANKITRVTVCGLATDHCVKATVLDAIKYGYETFVVAHACRGIDPEDSANALHEMGEAGALVLSYGTLA